MIDWCEWSETHLDLVRAKSTKEDTLNNVCTQQGQKHSKIGENLEKG